MFSVWPLCIVSNNNVLFQGITCCRQPRQKSLTHDHQGKSSHCANFSNFPIVPDIPLPISAALLANSDRLGCASPFAPVFAAFCESERSDCRCAPTFDDVCRRCTWAKTDRNSVVRSWIEDTAILWRKEFYSNDELGNETTLCVKCQAACQAQWCCLVAERFCLPEARIATLNWRDLRVPDYYRLYKITCQNKGVAVTAWRVCRKGMMNCLVAQCDEGNGFVSFE